MTSFFSYLWLKYCQREWQRFDRDAGQAASCQKKLLLDTLRHNSQTDYGHRYRFDRITSIEQFQESVPLTIFDDYQQEIIAIADGRDHVLTRDRVLLFEPSSGSTSAIKLIPYTASLRQQFQRGINGWLYNLYSHHPQLRGKAYWSISPASSYTPPHSCAIPVGFENDSDYLGLPGRLITNSLQAVPAEVTGISDIESFRYVTLLFLLSRRDLRLISVWNPTFLHLLLDGLPEYWNRLCADLDAGTVSPPVSLDRNLGNRLAGTLAPDPQRVREIASYGPDNLEKIWPELGLISCWRDGVSAMYADRLQSAWFPGVPFQGKGLIATEAFISFPLVGKEGAVLSGRSHFFEFLPLDEFGIVDENRVLLAHQLEINASYSVVVTTGGGLYRYQLQDSVKVVGYYKELPLIRFMCKLDGISDIFGEKLSQGFVAHQLTRLFEQYALHPCFYLLCPAVDLGHYVLYINDEQVSKEIGSLLAAELDRQLRENFHYDYCRKLGQLQQLRVVITQPGAARRYIDFCQSEGKRLGDIKMSVLRKTPLDPSLDLH